MSTSRVLAAVSLLGLSLFLLLGFFQADLMERGLAVAVLTFLIAVVLPALGGVALLLGGRRARDARGARHEELRRRTIEAELLRLASAQPADAAGRRKLTAADAVSALTLDVDTARSTLDDLHRRSVCELELTDDGTMTYAFRLADARQKHEARGVLDA